ncbi:MAG: hypothetical protein M1839_004805 [Geoglossum umbratile]|nr:MAG: hypothetical protein M1839_004805 [Geoglossum umbratile]
MLFVLVDKQALSLLCAPLIWKDRQHKALTGYGRKGKPGKAKKEKRGKGKQKATDDDENAAGAKNAENVELGDPNTDEEVEAMYMLRLGEAAVENSD